MTVLPRVNPLERVNLSVWKWIREQHLRRYQWACTFAGGKRVLDAACGTGYGSHMLVTQGKAAQVVGLDVASEVINENRRRYSAQPNLSFEVGDVCQLEFPPGSFDLYACFETIEHVLEPLALLQEAKRVLRPGGVLLLSTPNRELTNPGKTLGDRPFNRYHLREWNFAEFTELVSQVFPKHEVFIQAPFSRAYATFLRAIGRCSHWLGFRTHQACKVLITLLGRFPPCEVQPPLPNHLGEVIVIRAVTA